MIRKIKLEDLQKCGSIYAKAFPIEYWVTGSPVVSNGIVIDPGAMGFGIVEAKEIAYINRKLKEAKAKLNDIELSQDVLYVFSEEELIDAYEDLCEMYQKAQDSNLGLMMTF